LITKTKQSTLLRLHNIHHSAVEKEIGVQTKPLEGGETYNCRKLLYKGGGAVQIVVL